MTQEQVAVTAEKIRAGKTSLGIEFGSTRIKAVLIDDAYHTIAAGDYEWASHLEDGLWSYTQEEIWKGLQTAYARMVAARVDRQMMNRVVSAIALSTGSTPRQVRDRLQKGGIRR